MKIEHNQHMADPLSVASGLVAVIGASTACAKQLSAIVRSYRDAPGEILALTNEVSDMSVVLTEMTAVCPLPEVMPGSVRQHHDDQFHSLLNAELARSMQTLAELTTLVKSLHGDLHTGTYVNRIALLRKMPPVRKLQLQLRSTRERLHRLLDVKTTSGCTRIELALETLNATALQNHDDNRDLLVQILCELRDLDLSRQQSEVLPRDIVHGALGSQDTAEDSTGLTLSSGPIAEKSYYQGKHFILGFHMLTRSQCQRQCDCCCHRQNRRQSPNVLSKLFGTLFIGYSGLPVLSSKCNNKFCINGAACTIEITYCFPRWFLAKAIYLVLAKTCTGDPSFGLTIQRRVDPARQDSIIRLARTGDTEAIRVMLDKRLAHPNDVDVFSGEPALRAAIFCGHLDTCRLLLKEGANPYLEDDFGTSPIDVAWRSFAINTSTSEYLNELSSLFSGIEYDNWDMSELHKIVLGILPLDLEEQLQKPYARAQVNLVDSRDRTPLHWAAIRGDASAVENLLLAGANPNFQSRGKDTPLHLAALSQNPRVFELLIKAGADVRSVSSWGEAPLNSACNRRDVVACVELLVKNGADVDHRDRRGDTPLSFAATRNNVQIGSFLLKANANIRTASEGGETPPFHAIFGGSYEFLELLLQSGADCTNVTIQGSTILHFTAQHGDAKTTRILTSAGLRGINPDAIDSKGRTAMQVLEQRPVIEEGFKEAFRKLMDSIIATRVEGSEDSDTWFDAPCWPEDDSSFASN